MTRFETGDFRNIPYDSFLATLTTNSESQFFEYWAFGVQILTRATVRM